MITQVKLKTRHHDEDVVIHLEQMTHMKSASDSYGNTYTEIHFAGGESIEVNETIQQCRKAIANGLHGVDED